MRKLWISGPTEVNVGEEDVKFTLENPPDEMESVRWIIHPGGGTFPTKGEYFTWKPSALTGGTTYTIQADVLDDDEEVVETVVTKVLACAPAINSDTPDFDDKTSEATFKLCNVDTTKRYFWETDPDVGKIEWSGNGISATLSIEPKKLKSRFTVIASRGTTAGGTKVAELPVRVIGFGRRDRQAVGVSMQRTDRPPTPDQILWVLIRNSVRALSFPSYETFIDVVFCGDLKALCDPNGTIESRHRLLTKARADARDMPLRLPFPGVDPYRLLKAATEVFVTSRCGVLRFDSPLRPAEEERRGVFGLTNDPEDYEKAYEDYLNSDEDPRQILPYLALVLRRLGEVHLVSKFAVGEEYQVCEGIIQERLAYPCLIELIWSYWHEEGMLAQTMNAISQRFQNLRAPGPRDPFAQLEIDPLRPLNNLLWGYVQDEQHRLGVLRRAHEYDHHYGMPLVGKALAELRTADVRSKFVESFHNLLYQTLQFYRQDDDTTVVADGFPVLNALKETHYLLAQGAHNQFGDLPSTSRQEMLIEQWLLSRPEMREFLGGRVMVPYPEPWMDKVDVVKTLKGWTDVSVVHFHDLAVFGEQILLSVRYGGWSIVNDPDQAANWARYWRPEVQGYMHGYRATAGVDLTSDITDQQQLVARALPPSVHLRERLAYQLRGRGVAQIATSRITAQVVTSARAALPVGSPPNRAQLTKGGQ